MSGRFLTYTLEPYGVRRWLCYIQQVLLPGPAHSRVAHSMADLDLLVNLWMQFTLSDTEGKEVAWALIAI